MVTYGGVGGTLFGSSAMGVETDQTCAGVTVMYPGTASSSGASFSTYLHATP